MTSTTTDTTGYIYMNPGVTTSTVTGYVPSATTTRTVYASPSVIAITDEEKNNNNNAQAKEKKKMARTKLGAKTLYKDVRTGEIFRYEVAEDKKELFIKTETGNAAVNIETGVNWAISDDDPVEVVKAIIETCE